MLPLMTPYLQIPPLAVAGANEHDGDDDEEGSRDERKGRTKSNLVRFWLITLSPPYRVFLYVLSDRYRSGRTRSLNSRSSITTPILFCSRMPNRPSAVRDIYDTRACMSRRHFPSTLHAMGRDSRPDLLLLLSLSDSPGKSEIQRLSASCRQRD